MHHKTIERMSTVFCISFLALTPAEFTFAQAPRAALDPAATRERARKVYDAVLPSIVRFAYGEERKIPLGSGVIVSAEGHVAISGPVHAVLDDDLIDLRLSDGRRVKAQALGWSSEFGFGMLKINDPGPWPHVELSDQTSVGEVCVALGYPRNISGEGSRAEIRLGVISRSSDGLWLTTSYPSPFSSHGVFSLEGKLAGLNCATVAGGDAIHASATLVKTHWDDLVADTNLDRVRLLLQEPERQGTTAAPQESEEATAIALEGAKAATVRISDIGEENSLASGIIVTRDGYVITCGHHERMPGEELRVSLHDGRSVTAIVLGTNLVSDVGVMKITDEGTWPHAEMGHSAILQTGDNCVLIGYPKSMPERDPWILNTQIIKPTQTLPSKDEWRRDFWTEGSPHSLGGASGGGVFDTQGRVIGVMLGGSGEVMKHSRVELFRKNWDALTAGAPVLVVDAEWLDEVTSTLNRIADELAAELATR